MLDYKKTIENLTREQKIAMLSNASVSLDGVDPVTFVSFDGANEEIGRFPSLRAVTRSWDRELACFVAGGIAEQAKAEGKNALVLDKNLSLCNPYREGLSEDPYLAGRMGSAFASGTKNVNGAISVCASGIDSMQKTYLDDKTDTGTSYKFFVEPLLTSLRGGNESVILCEGASDNSGLMRSAIDSVRKNGIVVRKGLDAKQTLEAALKGEVVFGGRDDELRKVLDEYDDLSQQVISGRKTNEDLAAAVAQKRALREDAFDVALQNALKLVDYCNQDKFVGGQSEQKPTYNTKNIAKRACLESTVLLKNDNFILPIAQSKKVALLGIDAEKQIGNQSFYGAFEDYCAARGYTFVGYAPACGEDNDFDDRARMLCASADVIVCVFEKDEHNYSTFSLPSDRQKFAREIADYSANAVAIVFADSPVDMSFDKAFSAVLFAPQNGEYLFESVCDLAFGKAVPSGKLPFTLHDRADEYFAERRRSKAYRRIGSFVGYRYYDTTGEVVKYPFGYGLSYTQFAYSSLVAVDGEIAFEVQNTGNISGDEIVQIYIGRQDKTLPYAKKELIGFARVSLNPSEKKTVRLKLDPLATYDETKRSFVKEGGKFVVYICSNAKDVRLQSNMNVKGDAQRKPKDSLSDYIPVSTEENRKEYSFDGVSRKKKNAAGIVTSVLVMLIGIAADALLYFEKDSFDVTVFWVIVALANIVVLTGIVGLIASSARRKLKKTIDPAPSVSTENELFKEEFGDFAPSVNTEKKNAIADKKHKTDDEWFDYDKNYGFLEMFADFKKYCKERGFLLSDNTVKETLCAISSSRIIVVKADEKVYQGYVALASGYFGAKPYVDVVTPTFVKSKMLKNEKDGAQASSGFASACMSAKNKGKTVFYMLLNADLTNSSYLNDVCEAVTHTSKREVASGCVVSENMRIFVRKGDKNIPDTLCKACAVVCPEIEFAKESATKTAVRIPDYRQLAYVSDMVTKSFAMSEDRWKKLDKEENEINERSPFEIDNKDWQRIERYSSAFLAMSDLSEDKAEAAYDCALDETVLAILSERMINACANVKADDWSLASSIDRNFGDGVMGKTEREVKDAAAKGGKDDE